MKQDINSTVNQLFFHLFSAAIWDKEADAALFEGLDDKTWKQIAEMAIRQSASALIADKALSLPHGCLPSRSMKLQFLAFVQQTEALNKKMIKVLGNLKEEYDQAGFPFCLLKGLSVGVNYPKPLLRSAGDIDLYLYGEGDYERAKEWIEGKGFETIEEHSMHFAYKKNDVVIEIHRRFTFFDNRKFDKLLKIRENEIKNENNYPTVEIDSIQLHQLPVVDNAIFIFHHLFRHFIQEGVGFRQVCDWLLFLEKHRDKIDIKSFTNIANQYALLYPMQVFARATVKYLDASEDIFPFEMIKNNIHIEMVVEDMLQSGNFGFYGDNKQQRPNDKIRRLWHSFRHTIIRSNKFADIAPAHIKVLPYEKMINRMKKGLK